MADIRINALATTAASTASDDFIAVDGSANGTRKLNAYSPTFGGNLTVSGTSTIANGTAAAPSLVFAGSTTTGLYRYGANVVGLAMNGLHGFAFNGSGEMYGPGVNGYVSLPSAGGVSLTAGGTNQNITLTPSGTGKILLKLGDVDSQVNVEKRSTADIAFLAGNAAGSAARTLYFQGASVQFGIGGVGEVGRFAPTTGNFLLGTTTDSSNGKLQLATHTTSAGGIGFGTDTTLSRATNAGWMILGTTGTSSIFFLQGGGSGVYFNSTGSNFATGIIEGSGSLLLRTGNTTALTLDSSQNATFAGAGTFNKFVSVNFGADNCFFTGNPGQAIFFRTALDATAGTQTRNSPSAFFRGAYWDGAATANIDATIKVTASTTVANNSLDFGFTTGGGTQSLRIFQSGNATFAGSIAIGNTVQTAASVASTHKVTIVIGGVTYYLLATNV